MTKDSVIGLGREAVESIATTERTRGWVAGAAPNKCCTTWNFKVLVMEIGLFVSIVVSRIFKKNIKFPHSIHDGRNLTCSLFYHEHGFTIKTVTKNSLKLGAQLHICIRKPDPVQDSAQSVVFSPRCLVFSYQ